MTAHKEAEERERQSAAILRNIVDSSPNAIFVKDRSLRMVLCNSAHSKAVGKAPPETYGRTDIENGWSAELVKGNPEKGIKGWEDDDLTALSGKTVQVSGVPSNVGNQIRFFDVVKMPRYDADGMIVGIIGFGRDVTKRVRAENELRKSKDFAENLINSANVMILGFDSEGRVNVYNKAAEKITGYTREEIEQGSWFGTVIPVEHHEVVVGQFRRLFRDKDTVSFENQIRTKSGESRDIAWQNSLILENGRVTGTLSFGIDITDRRRMERDLAWERSLFTLLMDNAPEYIYFKDLESRFIRTSRSHARVLGLRDPSEAVGKKDADFYGADHAQKALEDEQRVLATGIPLVDIEERETYPDRPDTWAITTKMPFRDPAGRIVGTFGITHDITQRKLLEEKNRHLAMLVEAAEDAIMGIGMDRTFSVWNKGAERIFGYSAEEMIGQTTSRILPPFMEDKAREMRERLARGQPIERFETQVVRKDGARIDVSLTLSAVRDPQGNFVAMASVARDITAQKAMQAQLNRIQRLESLATLAGGVAHQFNNINTVVRGYLELLQSAPGLPAELASYVEAAAAGVQRAVDITDRLLALTEPAGPASGTVRLDVLVRGLLPPYRTRIEKEDVRLDLQLAETAPVAGDESRLGFALGSLIGNALDSLLDRAERTVRIRTGIAVDGAYCEIEDSGCGIPEEDVARIFSPFFSRKGEWAPHGSPQAKLRGVGLSLAISGTIVSEYGGRINVKSVKGVGSTFTVVMPLARQDS